MADESDGPAVPPQPDAEISLNPQPIPPNEPRPLENLHPTNKEGTAP